MDNLALREPPRFPSYEAFLASELSDASGSAPVMHKLLNNLVRAGAQAGSAASNVMGRRFAGRADGLPGGA